jgi:hypothetical protein
MNPAGDRRRLISHTEDNRSRATPKITKGCPKLNTDICKFKICKKTMLMGKVEQCKEQYEQ